MLDLDALRLVLKFRASRQKTSLWMCQEGETIRIFGLAFSLKDLCFHVFLREVSVCNASFIGEYICHLCLLHVLLNRVYDLVHGDVANLSLNIFGCRLVPEYLKPSYYLIIL